MNELAQAVYESGLDTLLEHIHAVVVLVDTDGTLIAWNSAFNQFKDTDPPSNKLQECILPEEKEELLRRLKLLPGVAPAGNWRVDFTADLDSSQTCFDCILLPTATGRALFVGERLSADPAVSQSINKLNRLVKLFRIESEIAKKLARNKQVEVEAVMAQAHEISNLDVLTFLPNRRQIIRELQMEVLRAQRYNSLLSISILDIDHFKLINDTYGHAVGDHVLREVAIQLRDHVREPDTVARYGGEEFLILLPNSAKEAASEQAARLCKQVRDSVIRVDDHEIRVTLSIGVAEFHRSSDSWQTLLSHADTALYEAKSAGRDRWAISAA
jgi:diguanylate cyclase (GGDEF)-like protein